MQVKFRSNFKPDLLDERKTLLKILKQNHVANV